MPDHSSRARSRSTDLLHRRVDCDDPGARRPPERRRVGAGRHLVARSDEAIARVGHAHERLEPSVHELLEERLAAALADPRCTTLRLRPSGRAGDLDPAELAAGRRVLPRLHDHGAVVRLGPVVGL